MRVDQAWREDRVGLVRSIGGETLPVDFRPRSDVDNATATMRIRRIKP